MWECLSAGDEGNKLDGEYIRKCYEMLPRNWSAPCEVGEMRHKFRFKFGGFQLVGASNFEIICEGLH